MRLLLITAAFPPIKSGGSDYAMRLAEQLARRNIEVYVLTSDMAQVESRDYQIYASIKRWDWPALFKIWHVIAHLKPDLIDIHFAGWVFNDHPMITFLPWLIKRIAPSSHLSVHIESLGGAWRARNSALTVALRFLFSLVIGRRRINFEYGSLVRDCDSLIVLSESVAQALEEMFPGTKRKCAVLPPPPLMRIAPRLDQITAQGLLKRFSIEHSQLLLAFYGYLYPGKGLETLFAAVKKLQGLHPTVSLLLIGDAPATEALERCQRPDYLHELKNLSNSLGIEDALRWVGYSECTSELPSRLLQLAKICILPFDQGVMLNNSSFSFAARHAMPIITTQSPKTENTFVNRKNALLVAPKDENQLAAAVEEVCSNSTLAAALSVGAGALYQSVYSWEGSVNQTLALWGITERGEEGRA